MLYVTMPPVRGIRESSLAKNMASYFRFSQLIIFKPKKKLCVSYYIKFQQEAHGPHRSPEKTVQINKHI